LRRFFGQDPPFFIVGHNCTPLLVVWALCRNLNNSSINGGFRGGDFSVRSGG
jgi:hypothetical protein